MEAVSKKKSDHHGATPATLALEKAGTSFTIRTFEHSSGVTDFGAEAADALAAEGYVAERICKTLMVDLTGGPHSGQMAVAIVPVTTSLDLKAVASAFGAKKATMADPTAAERSSGYVVGGISPLGQKKQLPTVLDLSAADHETILVSGGRRGLDIELTPDDLVGTLDATLAPVGRD
ncbi:MAG TPA: Cys-tRNA(Pro) deacylase [Candidatus Corynebacterium avicola]|uniref:Cys-tRNA(Pro)/Cys-tRNA(Cys) deacylase n=1 Tax=Candidatus Corynebacterium avicola TaxID=2838527 RepID=A0A9D1UN86_9CORY|nr:Cys-tRNA(Pro) deacylase [Candidatus Corynebacterium avicola]